MTLSNNTYKCVDMELVGGNVNVKLAINKDDILGTYAAHRDIILTLSATEAKQFEIGKEYTIDFNIYPPAVPAT